ncbi:MAG: hypothetical protein RI580_00420 [Halothece sp. Uz-M2-17]|nr:hypothetical protein [Halothece sp. Uz-M2-17]
MLTHPMLKATVASIVTIFLGGSGATYAFPQKQPLPEAKVKQNSAYNEFRSFLTNAVKNPDYWVSYEMEMPDHPTMMVEQWLKGEKFRIDTQVQGTMARLYRIGEEITNCIAQGSNWTCLRMPSLDQMKAPGIQGMDNLEDIQDNPQNYRNQITKVGTRMVAGETTTCFKVNELENNGSWLSCYSNNHGIPLYMEGQHSEGTWKMTATDFQLSVQNSDFSLPAQPQSIPGMPNGFQMPNR